MKIALCFPPAGPVGWHRGAFPARFLAQRGHEIVLIRGGETTEALDGVDVLWLIGPAGSLDQLAFYRDQDAALVVEYDDDVWGWQDDPASQDPAHVALARVSGLPLVTKERAALVAAWLEAADAAVTTTPYLAERLRAHGAREVFVCPNAVPPEWTKITRERFLPPTSVIAKARAPRRGPAGPAPKLMPAQRTIAWTGSVSHVADLPPVLEAIRRVGFEGSIACSSLGPVDFTQRPEWSGFTMDYSRVMLLKGAQRQGDGSLAPACGVAMVSAAIARELEEKGVAQSTVDFTLYPAALQGMKATVAVIPMRSSPFNRAKSPVTGLTWSALGVPFVASRTAAYAELERAGFPGAIFVEHENVDQWVEALRSILYDPGRARALAEAGLRWITQNASYPKAAEPWERAFEEAVALHKARAWGQLDE